MIIDVTFSEILMRFNSSVKNLTLLIVELFFCTIGIKLSKGINGSRVITGNGAASAYPFICFFKLDIIYRAKTFFNSIFAEP
jgi:hypothetical protein